MDKPKRTYKNAGMQSMQGRREAYKLYHQADDSALFTVKCISLVLEIRLQMVKQIPVQRIMIDKRGYYRKGDIRAWLAEDMERSDSLLKKLRDEHAKTVARMRKQPSRFYDPDRLPADEVQKIRERNKAAKGKGPADRYEALKVARKSGALDGDGINMGGGRSAIAAADLMKLWLRPNKSKKV